MKKYVFWILLCVSAISNINCSPFEGSSTPSGTGEPPNLDLFLEFKNAVGRNCLHCHGGPDSLYPGIVNFAILETPEAWQEASLKLIVPGDRVASPIYNRLTLARGKVPNPNNNMPFPAPGYPVTMSAEEAEFIGLYIDSLEVKILDKPNLNAAYGALVKVKYIVTGEAVTQDDINTLIAVDPASGQSSIRQEQLRLKIIDWLNTPNGRRKLDNFLRITLQQDQWEYPRTGTFQLGIMRPITNNPFRNAFFQNIRDSFIRSALDTINTEKPFTSIVNSRRQMVTTAMLSAMSFAEGAGRPVDFVRTDSTFSDFMRDNMQASDFTDWRLVNLTNGTPINYDDLAQIRGIAAGQSYNLRIPRVGFFNTLGFQFSWPTNGDNDFRVTTSQTVLVSLNEAFEASDDTPHGNLDALNEEHAGPGSVCYQCHRLLDPMRETFRAHYDQFYGLTDGADKVTSVFAFKGHSGPSNNVNQLANTIASHPNFAKGWVSKYCTYTNSEKCNENDPDFIRVVDNFKNSNHNFKLMVADLLSSPIVTATSGGIAGGNPGLISSTRRNHFCSGLTHRYQQLLVAQGKAYSLPAGNLCSLTAASRQASATIAVDTTNRGEAGISNSPDSNAFTTIAIEKTCREIAQLVVTDDNLQGFNCCQIPQVNSSIDSMTIYLMGLPSIHPRYSKTKTFLNEFFTHARTQPGADDLMALRETFVFACTSPDVTGMGL